jgi:hypothetical protein
MGLCCLQTVFRALLSYSCLSILMDSLTSISSHLHMPVCHATHRKLTQAECYVTTAKYNDVRHQEFFTVKIHNMFADYEVIRWTKKKDTFSN